MNVWCENKLPVLKINNCVIKRENAIKSLGVIIDENLTWKTHIDEIQNKISKNLGVLYTAKFLLKANHLLYKQRCHQYC